MWGTLVAGRGLALPTGRSHVRVLLATDRPTLGAALSLFLSERGIEVVGVLSRAQDLGAAAAATAADVVIIDSHLGDEVAAEIVTDLERGGTGAHVVVLGSAEGAASDVPGADAFATLGDPPEALLRLLDDVTSVRDRTNLR